jgi:hypothetical protein
MKRNKNEKEAKKILSRLYFLLSIIKGANRIRIGLRAPWK